MKNYSQSNEQEVILKYFGDQVGKFIEFGSNDGVTFSNTLALSEKGWKGVHVEPSPRAFHLLKKNYADRFETKGSFYFYNCAIGEKNGKAILHESDSLLNTNDVALVSTLIPEEKERFKNATKYQEVEVQVFRWKTFSNRLSITDFDLVCCDTEGCEIIILRQMDLSNVKMVVVEHNGKNHDKFKEICSGMNVIYESPENLIFAR